MHTWLVSMPFADVRRPSIQLGLLKALATRSGLGVTAVHPSLDLALAIGPERYGELAEHRGRMVGDWLFSLAAFGDAAPDPTGAFLTAFKGDLGEVDDLTTIRQEIVPRFLDELLDAHPWSDVDVVAFSSTFQQNTASFALARRLKERWPEIVTIFGGANFDGEMGLEYVRTVDCIDYAVIGEGDLAFPRVLSALADGTDPGAVPGVARRIDGDVVVTPPAPLLRSLDELPDPDYDDYFERAEQLGLLPGTQRRSTWIPFESARGCWWGEKHHCTFCGLNGTSMTFRSKSPARVIDELSRQARRYGSFNFEAVDNILDLAYLDKLLPALRETRTDYEIFYEVKANLTQSEPQGTRRRWGPPYPTRPGVAELERAAAHAQRRPSRAERQRAPVGSVLRHRRRVESALGLSGRDRGRL